MDTYSSGEDPQIKSRKPYTISKQRERWTDEEHNRFLEALKLHGRAWQRIEEHIGTKTAVQIRSHAQKFFSKLEKDAHVKGVPISKAIDIEIPPPRPKRKPSNPYPRKTGVCASTTQAATKDSNLLTSVSSSCPGNQTPELEKVSISEQAGQVEDPANSKETQNDNASDILGLFQEAPCTSVSSANKLPRQPSTLLIRSCSFKEIVPPSKEAANRNEANVNIEPIVTQRPDKSDANERILDNIAQGNEGKETEMQANQNYPRHVPVYIVDGNIIGSSSQTSFSDTSYQEPFFHQGHPTLFNGLSNVKKSTIHQCVPNFHPPLFPPVCDNQQDYRSFSVFSNLIISTLLQNPLAHAAASFAASICPSDNTNSFAESQFRATPSMAAITAATVAAATAWWAAHGLLPLYNPLNTCFPCTPPGYGAEASPMDPDQAPRENTLQDQVLEGHSKLPFSSSDSEEPNIESKDPEQEKTVVATEIEDDLNTAEVRKRVNPSSCGSNTPSSSEVETDALEKHDEKTMDESKDEPDTGHPVGDSMNRRIRSNTYNLNESWKEVSDEGKLAFRALFARQRLPQSFSPPPDLNNIGHQNMNIEEDKQNADPKTEKPLLLDLNSNALGFGSCQDNEKNVFLTVNSGDEGLLTIGLGQGKLKARRTGFKPYKRCSVEAKVTADSCQGEEKGPKRIRLESEALS